MYRVVFLEEALAEIQSASIWYAEQQMGLDERFARNISDAIEKLRSDTITYKPIYRKLNRILVKRFPYAIYFKKDMENRQITILGVLHSRQHRSQLLKRI